MTEVREVVHQGLKGHLIAGKSIRSSLNLADLWTVACDTDQLNERSGNNAYSAFEILQDDGSVVRRVHTTVGPFTCIWEESFGEHVDQKLVRQERKFLKGPFTNVTLNIRIDEDAEGLSADVEFTLKWDSLLGSSLARLGQFYQMVKQRATAMEDMIRDAEAADGRVRRKPLMPEARKQPEITRVAHNITELENAVGGKEIAAPFLSYIEETHPLDLDRIRPLAVARDLHRPSEEVLTVCLHAHKQGMLSMHWDLLCPRCRGAKERTLLLSDLPQEVHCTSCNVSFDRDFNKNVELTFRPMPWFREVPDGEFCMMGPLSTPHIKLQRVVQPGETHEEILVLGEGRYNVRTVEAGDEEDVDFDGKSAFPEIFAYGKSIDTRTGSHDAGTISMVNNTDHPMTFVIEEKNWITDALTGEKVIAMPLFRDLCPEQVLRPGDEVSIGHTTILFTDLKGSTALYAEIGDTRAYRLVQDHFIYLFDRIHKHEGVIIKTIGDAVMAAFEDPVQAMSAALDIQKELSLFNRGRETQIALKIGYHRGACIAINNDGHLDYFGNAVNLAARIEGCSLGNDIVWSKDMMNDPELSELLMGEDLEESTVTLAGIPHPVDIVRLRFHS